jgi:chromosomal replication initiator protein
VLPRASRASGSTAVEEIQQHVSETFDISLAELVGTTRAAAPVRARQIAIYLTRELTDLSLPQIGRLYGGRDHSTVLNSIRRAEARCKEDETLAARVEGLRAAIHNGSTHAS